MGLTGTVQSYSNTAGLLLGFPLSGAASKYTPHLLHLLERAYFLTALYIKRPNLCT